MADDLANLLDRLGLEHQVSQLVPGTFKAMVRAAVAEGPDLVVVLGGDGTARLVAEACGPDGPLVAPLPCGTMSKLSRALYGPKPWSEALFEALTHGTPRWTPGGSAGGRAFFCSAVLGSPARWARAREAVRARRLGQAWRQAVGATHRTFLTRLWYDLDGAVGRARAIDFICPTVSRALAHDEGALEAAVLNPAGAGAGVRLAVGSLFGDWRRDPDVSVRPSVHGRVWARGAIPAMLDGEFFRLGRKIEVRFRPRAFRALV